jgi:hypothetical protein
MSVQQQNVIEITQIPMAHRVPHFSRVLCARGGDFSVLEIQFEEARPNTTG